MCALEVASSSSKMQYKFRPLTPCFAYAKGMCACGVSFVIHYRKREVCVHPHITTPNIKEKKTQRFEISLQPCCPADECKHMFQPCVRNCYPILRCDKFPLQEYFRDKLYNRTSQVHHRPRALRFCHLNLELTRVVVSASKPS